MRRIVLLAVCAAFMLCGCYRTEPLDLPTDGQTKGETSMGGTTLGTSQTTGETRVSQIKETSASQTMAETKATRNQIDALESRVAVLESQITELKNTTVTTAKTKGTTAAKTTVVSTTAIPPKSKLIPLNVEAQSRNGTITFTKLELVSNRREFLLHYEFRKKTDGPGAGWTTFLIGKSGQKYNGNFVKLGSNATDNSGVFKNSIVFKKSDHGTIDLSDLSTVTFTFDYWEHEPETVTFDIPGV